MVNNMQKGKQLYAGKAKTIYATDDPDRLIMQYRDDVTAFDGEKKQQLINKGKINNLINAFIMAKLEAAGIACHFDRLISDTESLVKHLEMIPVECVIRNYAAGSICRRLGLTEGVAIRPSVFEFFLKDDALHDPFINEHHIRTFNWATQQEIDTMKQVSFAVNEVLQALFLQADILLVDFKLEFGRYGDQIILGDEFTPDGCRLWDKDTKRKLDKDRFRKDLGDVVGAYQEVATRLGIISH